jgi:hypothetical protein
MCVVYHFSTAVLIKLAVSFLFLAQSVLVTKNGDEVYGTTGASYINTLG